jgi:hypothetical protein
MTQGYCGMGDFGWGYLAFSFLVIFFVTDFVEWGYHQLGHRYVALPLGRGTCASVSGSNTSHEFKETYCKSAQRIIMRIMCVVGLREPCSTPPPTHHHHHVHTHRRRQFLSVATSLVRPFRRTATTAL